MRLWIQISATMSGAAVTDSTHPEHAALEAREPHVLAVGHLRQLRGSVAGACDPHPVGRLRAEVLGGGERDQLRCALGLSQDAAPERSRGAIDVLDMLGFSRTHER